MRRWPLWTTLLPLVAGLAIYWVYWDRERDAFEATLAPVFGDGRATVGGFPYRLEAQVAGPRLAHDGQYRLDVRAESVVLNRQPWRETLTFARTLAPSLEWQAVGFDGATFTVRSATAEASLNLADGRIARLSTVHPDATVRLPFVPIPANAESFEWHFRETPAAPDPASRAPTFPEQAQLVMRAEALRFGRGDPLTFEAQLGVTSAAPIWDLAGWRRGGTFELRRVTLADKAGVIVAITATGSAGPAESLRIAGVIETVCPLSLRAAFAGTTALAREYRTRRPVKLGFSGPATDLRLTLPPGGLPRRPVRAQEAPCPILAR